MTDAPERIWALMTPRGGLSISSDGLPLNANPEDTQVEYLRADLVPRWSDDMDAAPKDWTTHARGLWVYNAQTGKPMYWQADIGHYDSGEFIGPSGDDFGWRADDYTHWMPLPAPPKEGE